MLRSSPVRRAPLLVLLVVSIASCDSTGGGAGGGGGSGSTGAGGGGAKSGLYIGSHVSFRIEGSTVREITLKGISCHVPHPDFADLGVNACFVQAPGLPEETLSLVGNGIDGVAGGVELTGTVQGGKAKGVWRFTTLCAGAIGALPCHTEGTWDAVLFEETGGLPDSVVPGEGEDPADDGDGTPSDPSDPSEPEPSNLPPGGGNDDPGVTEPDGGDEPVAIDPSQVTTPEDASAAQKEAQALLVEIRDLVGLPVPVQDGDINAAAQAHADYYSVHEGQYDLSGLSPHNEDPAWPEGFTGESVGDRLKFQGVSLGNGWGEVMAFTGSAQGAIDGWMDTLYHRIPLVHPNTAKWGFGMHVGPGAHCETADVVSGPATVEGPALWPVPGAEGVDTYWNGWESPQPPLPKGESYPSGPIVTVTFANGTSLSLDEAVLLDPDGIEVPAAVRSPENDSFLGTTWAIYAYDPLDSDTTYTVRFEGAVGGKADTVEWSFTTK